MSAYLLLKFLHVFFAIAAVGSNVTYGLWLARAAREPQHLGHVLRGIKVLDDRVANPSYGLALVTGLLLVWSGGLSFGTFWIHTSLALWVVLAIVGFGFYTPTLRRQIEAYDQFGPDSDEYRRLARRGRSIGMLLMIPTLLIVFLMVTKPTL